MFNNTLNSCNHIGVPIKTYAEEEEKMSRHRQLLISSFILQNGTLITSLVLFHLELDLACTEIHRFVGFTPRKCFNSFVQSPVDARRQGDESPNPSVVAETMKLPANSSHGNQIMDPSRHTVTKYLNDEKTHTAIDSKLFKKVNQMNNAIFEIELTKAEIELNEPIIVSFFILQQAKLRIYDLSYNFISICLDVNKME